MTIVVFPFLAEDVVDPHLLVEEVGVHADAGGMVAQAGVKLVELVLVFRAGIRPDRQDAAVSRLGLPQAEPDVEVFVVLGSLHAHPLLLFRSRC